MRPGSTSMLVIRYGLTIFLSAFLLFQIQPMIGKMILPWFGGSASVWTTCMLFFQVLLLLGYLYSHFVMRALSPGRQSALHILLLLAALACLPLAPSPGWRPTGSENPTLRILLLLGATLGLPYFVLSTTGPLIQAWFAREHSGAVPYRLFALSNLGSLLALLAYPLLLERALPTRWQSWLWSLLFAAFVLVCASLAWRGRLSAVLRDAAAGTAPPAAACAPRPGLGRRLGWVALAACPSILLIADTSFLTENVAPIPLLWVLPLALYLLSFILCFERRGGYPRRLFLPLMLLALAALGWLPTLGLNALPPLAAMAINLAAFFVVCMVCHGELAAMKPHPSVLTLYFLMLALGGACGGLFVGVVAPYCFNSNYEYSIALVLATLVVSATVILRFCPRDRRPPAWAAAAALALLVAGVRIEDHRDQLEGARLLVRNFYGSQGVFDVGSGPDGHRTLMHGQIIHGKQYTDPSRLDWPTTYYTHESGVGRALLTKSAQGPLRVGLVGLGAGTLACYGRPGDTYRFYEIDPLVVKLAREEFSFLARDRADSTVVLGDARLMLEDEPAQHFDVLVIDAFSGDSVPVHLLTREAFASYFRHLKPDGVLAIHVTNRFLDLPPVVAAGARSFGRDVRLVETESDRSREVYRSVWALVSAEPAVFEAPLLRPVVRTVPTDAAFRPWTDDYSSVFAVLK